MKERDMAALDKWPLKFPSDASLGFCLVSGLAPWLLLPMILADWRVAVVLAIMTGAMTGTGYAFLNIAKLALPGPKTGLAFTPGAGLILYSACFALAASLGWSAHGVFWVCMMVGAAGAALLCKEAWARRRERIAGGGLLILVSMLVAVTLFLPALRLDLVRTGRNGFSWMHVHSAFNMAVAVSIKAGGQPAMPGMATGPLVYHFGHQAIAALFSGELGAELRDCMLALRGYGLVALLAATAGLGAATARFYGDRQLSPAMGVLGLFFCGAFTAPYLAELLSRLYLKAGGSVARVGPLKELVPYSQGMVSHFSQGHSALWSLVGLTVVCGLFLLHAQHQCSPHALRTISLLPGLVLPLNVFAGLVSTGLLAGLFIFQGFSRGMTKRPYALVVTMVTVVMLSALGGGVEGGARFISVNASLAAAVAVLWQFLGYGVVLYAFRPVLFPPRAPLAMLIGLLALGGILSAVVLTTPANHDELYPLMFGFHLMAAFSFVFMGKPLRACLEGAHTVWLKEIRLFWLIVFVVTGIGLGLLLAQILLVSPSGRLTTLVIMTVLCLASFSIWRGVERSRQVAFLGTLLTAVGFVLFFGNAATAIYQQSQDHGQAGVALPPAEYAGLLELRRISSPADRCATNAGADGDGRHYVYVPISERRFLLEGWQFVERINPDFPRVRQDNDLIFSSTDTDVVKRIVEKYGIRYLVCRPGSGLPVACRQPAWLKGVPDTGSLTIYRVEL